MEELSRIHINSFNFFLKDGLKRMVKNLQPYEFCTPESDLYQMRVEFLELCSSLKSDNDGSVMLPHECRRRGLTYGVPMRLHIRLSINGTAASVIEVPCGDLPIMVLSRACQLSKLKRNEFPKHGEEERDLGGYFIINGKERVLRLIIMTRRNFPLAVARPSFKKRGHGYTEHAIIMRCVRDDEASTDGFFSTTAYSGIVNGVCCARILTHVAKGFQVTPLVFLSFFAQVVMLHWLMNSEPTLAIVLDREQFFIPVSIILRALVNKTEFEMFDDIRRGGGESLSLEETAMRILVHLKEEDYSSQSRALSYLGRLFRHRLHVLSALSDEETGIFLLKERFMIHLNSLVDKYHMLCLMIRKLHAFVSGQCCQESSDNLMFQEVLLPSTTYLHVIREKIIQLLSTTREHVILRSRRGKVKINATMIQQSFNQRAPDISAAIVFLLSTGSLPPSIRSNLVTAMNNQTTGISVPADNVNFLRSAAQFRAVHRGSMFVDMRTTSVRRLLPEAWGFMCPVHTPDGAPCGLLNHLAEPVDAVCVTPKQSIVDSLAQWLAKHKLRSVELSRQLSGVNEEQNALPVLLDGRLVGWCCSLADAEQLAEELRGMKVDKESTEIPYSLEIVVVPPTDVGSQYPGVYLFCGAARLLRPVVNLKHGKQTGPDGLIEWIGTFEQPYLDIAVSKTELMERSPTNRSHMELSPEVIFSFVAGLTPYQDFNQSPRNMYQCQMAKQTMGHSCYTWMHRSDAKAYRLLTPQSPLVRTKTYVKYDMDHYPIGFNAIVAVMSYTGYDMEDAMVINKGSYERGLAGACIYKSEVVDLSSLSKHVYSRPSFGRKIPNADHYFGTPHTPPPGLDWDGFPPIGTRLEPGISALYCFTHIETQHTTIVKYEGGEQIAYVDSISLNGCWSHATITLRLPRPPDIGDKYSSRHGQKGINSLLVPSEEMPWAVTSGIVPDLIFNPHGFPTRMTMGNMIEFLAGKSAALTGNRVDATPFQWTEDNPPYLDYCQQLADCGFNYWGTEMMMSGCDGRQLEAHIYIGVVYYQRLRHMVADKYQVRSEGRFDPILRQPIKGRKLGGGVRLGEMERDCLLSQGLCFTLQDRMVESNCDTVTMLACSKCGGLVHTDLARNIGDQQGLAPGPVGAASNWRTMEGSGPFDRNYWSCRLCDKDEDPSLSVSKSHLKRVQVSAAFRYLTYELACLNVRTQLTMSDLI